LSGEKPRWPRRLANPRHPLSCVLYALMDMSGSVIGVTTSALGLRSIKMVGTLPQNVNFAIKTDVVQTFLATNGITAETGGGREMGAADVGDRARTFTVLVECKG